MQEDEISFLLASNVSDISPLPVIIEGDGSGSTLSRHRRGPSASASAASLRSSSFSAGVSYTPDETSSLFSGSGMGAMGRSSLAQEVGSQRLIEIGRPTRWGLEK